MFNWLFKNDKKEEKEIIVAYPGQAEKESEEKEPTILDRMKENFCYPSNMEKESEKVSIEDIDLFTLERNLRIIGAKLNQGPRSFRSPNIYGFNDFELHTSWCAFAYTEHLVLHLNDVVVFEYRGDTPIIDTTLYTEEEIEAHNNRIRITCKYPEYLPYIKFFTNYIEQAADDFMDIMKMQELGRIQASLERNKC